MATPLLPLLAVGAACAGGSPPATTTASSSASSPPPAPAASIPTLAVEVAGLPAGSAIPAVHTCDGADRSPIVRWSAGPPSTLTYALVVDDPDAPSGTWVHWVVWNVVGTETMLAGGVSAKDGGLMQGLTSFQQIGWGGPCPPPGHGVHHYSFRVYALDRSLSLSTGATKATLEAAMAGHVQAQGEWIGLYERK